MTLIILTTTMVSVASSMFLANSPLSLGAMILFMALITAMTFSMSMSSWFAYFIFLIYIGGILIMFTYFVAMCPNQSMNMKYLLMFLFTSLIMYSLAVQMLKLMKYSTTFKMHYYSSMYTMSNNYMLMLLLMILLITMIFVVKITTRSAGPLRPFTYV